MELRHHQEQGQTFLPSEGAEGLGGGAHTLLPHWALMLHKHFFFGVAFHPLPTISFDEKNLLLKGCILKYFLILLFTWKIQVSKLVQGAIPTH